MPTLPSSAHMQLACLAHYTPPSLPGDGASHSPGSKPNLLFSGNNLDLLTTLHTPAGQQYIQERGGLKLVYIDPPFNVGSDFSCTLPCTTQEGETHTITQVAYSDCWKGNAYFSMLHQRLVLIHRLLHPTGALFVHCDWRTSAHIRLMLDSIFGEEQFLGEVIWHYTGGGRSNRYFSRKHDSIFHYAKSNTWTFNADAVRVPYKKSSGYAKGGITSKAGKHYTPNPLGTLPDDVWDIPIVNPMSHERLPYPTQKPEALLERIILGCSNPHDLVADFFCGSGTTLAVAAQHGRCWIGADQSLLAISTTQQRLASLQNRKTGSTPHTMQTHYILAAQKECFKAPEQEHTRNHIDIEVARLPETPQQCTVSLRNFTPVIPPCAANTPEQQHSNGLSFVAGWSVEWKNGTQPESVPPEQAPHDLSLLALTNTCFTPHWATWRQAHQPLTTTSPPHHLPAGASCRITVCVIDIFGQRHTRILVLPYNPCNTSA